MQPGHPGVGGCIGVSLGVDLLGVTMWCSRLTHPSNSDLTQEVNPGVAEELID